MIWMPCMLSIQVTSRVGFPKRVISKVLDWLKFSITLIYMQMHSTVLLLQQVTVFHRPHDKARSSILTSPHPIPALAQPAQV